MLNNIEPHIGSSCIRLSIAKDICDRLGHLYIVTMNITWIYEACQNILGLSKVHGLWMNTTIRMWPFVRRGTCINHFPFT
jgi:hypothetical protein